MISIIAAMSENRVIGKNGRLPWKLSADLKRFKELTMGHPIIMGRKTFESLGSQPLKGRLNLVVTASKDFYDKIFKIEESADTGLVPVQSLDEAISLTSKFKSDEIFIIGGGMIYKQTLLIADRIYLTLIRAEFEGDTHFPKIDWSEWHKTQENLYSSTSEFPYSYSFATFERIKKPR